MVRKASLFLGLLFTAQGLNYAKGAPCTSTLPFEQGSSANCTSLQVSGSGTVSNSGTISGGNASDGSVSGASLANTGTISTLNNQSTGVINGGSNGILNLNSSIGTFQNNSGGQVLGDSNGIENTGLSASITNFNNYGIITGSSAGIFNNDRASISTLTNYSTGVITGNRNYGIYNRDAGSSIGTIYNYGTIKWGGSAGTQVGIGNEGSIGTIVNAQGAGNSSGALTYQGALPTNYYILISSTTSYGKLDYNKGSAGAPSLTNLNFGIDSNSVLALGTYSSVLRSTDSTFTSSGTAFTGSATLLSFNGVTYTLTSSNGGVTYDLNILGLSAATGRNINISGTQYSELSGGTLTIDNSSSFSNSFSLASSATNTIDANGKNATLSGVFSDATSGGALNFTNSGTGGKIILSGTSTYTGSTTIGSGVLLSVNGSIATSSGVTVSNGGTLGGTGQLPATAITSGGTIAPGNSIGTLNVNGNVTFNSGSTFQVEANAAGQSDKIVSTGSAIISGGTVSVTPASGSYNSSTTYTILTTSSGVTGTFSGATSSVPSLRALLSYDAYNVFLRLLSGPSDTNTSTALAANQSSLRSLQNRRLTDLAFMSNYDCHMFDKYGVCLSFQARYSSFDVFNEGAGIFTGAYRLTDQVHLGIFIDYRASEKNPAGVKISKDLPSFGALVGYSQNQNGTGLQGKALAAVQKGDAAITRDNTLSSTEPGSGKSSLNSHMIYGELGWGSMLSPNMLATPYIGFQISNATRGGYSEETVSGSVDYPVTYNDFYQRLGTATAGIRLAGMFSEKVGYQLGVAIEHDLYQQTSSYSGTSTISGLTAFSLQTDGVNNRTRGIASAGAFYQVEKNQRIMGNFSFRNQAYTSRNAVSAMAGYQVAF